MSLYYNEPGKGWVLFKIYGPDSFVWEFTEIKKIEFPSGEIAYGDKLKELRREHPPEEIEYAYYPSDQQLYVDRSDTEEDGFIGICINDRYRVGRISKNEMWLYDLEDVNQEPEDYRFRMKIRSVGRRDSIFNRMRRILQNVMLSRKRRIRPSK